MSCPVATPSSNRAFFQVIDKRWRQFNETGADQNQNTTKDAQGFTILDFWLDQVKKGLLTLKDVNEEANSLLFGVSPLFACRNAFAH